MIYEVCSSAPRPYTPCGEEKIIAQVYVKKPSRYMVKKYGYEEALKRSIKDSIRKGKIKKY